MGGGRAWRLEGGTEGWGKMWEACGVLRISMCAKKDGCARIGIRAADEMHSRVPAGRVLISSGLVSPTRGDRSAKGEKS
eukprot:882003-Prymnesium_polylepis.1